MDKFQLNIVIATDGLPFLGDTLESRALGGSETAVIYVARELARMGHLVRVFCNCDNQGVFDNVRYVHNQNLERFKNHDECDVLIVSRHYQFFEVKYNSKLNILWNHDTLVNHNHLASVMWNIDFLWCLSGFHKANYTEKLSDLKDYIKIIANGFDPDLCIQSKEKKHKVMFTSRPERGLYKALELYEKLNDKELEFEYCSYKTIDVPEVQKIEQLCAHKSELLNRAGFKVTKSQYTKKSLYQAISESKAVIYPTQFPEIFCISAIEAQANGTAYITTDNFALKETVPYAKVQNPENYDNLFLTMMKQIIYNDIIRQGYEKEGLNYVQKYQWPEVVKKMETNIFEHFKTRAMNHTGIIDRLIYESDLLNAREYAQVYGMQKYEDRIKSWTSHLYRPDKYQDIYEDDDTHENGLLNLDEHLQNPRVLWLGKQAKRFKCGSMLDYACHTGSNAIMAALENPDIKIDGYDISKKAVKKANYRLEKQFNKLKNINFMDSEPGTEEKYDCLHLGEILEHVEKPDAFLNDLESRYCKPGGKVFITLPRGAWQMLTLTTNQKNHTRYHVHSFDLTDIMLMFSKKPDFEYTTTHYASGMYGEPMGHYLITYTADHKPIKHITNKKKWLTARPYQSIDACIITRNSEKVIEKMLDKIYNHMDMIHITLDHDPGENEILEQRLSDYEKADKLRVHHLEKRIVSDKYGFGNARNDSVKPSSADWIFWIDSDEDIVITDHFRKFLESDYMNAFAIKQHHSQFDTFLQADIPNRLYRREKGKFYGYVHEQAMSIDSVNKPITPAFLASFADIINHGELLETERREKALGRNLELLKVDAKINVEQAEKEGREIRKLTMVLIMRDFVNRIKWAYEATRDPKNRDSMELSLPKIKAIFGKYFAKETDELYKHEAIKQLNEALIFTGQGVPVAIQIGSQKNADNIKSIVIPNEKLDDFIKWVDNLR